LVGEVVKSLIARWPRIVKRWGSIFDR